MNRPTGKEEVTINIEKEKIQMQQSTIGDGSSNQQETMPMTVMTGRMTSNDMDDVAGGNGCGGVPM